MAVLIAAIRGCLKRHDQFVAYCKIMLYGINYTSYIVLTVQNCFHVPFWFLK